MKKLKVLLCGNSDSMYPRDETIISALKRIDFIEIYDLRIVDKKWTILDASKDNERAISNRILKRYTLLRIWKLIYFRQVDLVFVMKSNWFLVRYIHKWTSRFGIPIVYDLWVSRLIQAKTKGQDKDQWYDVEKEVIDKSTYLIATTEPYKKYYIDNYGCPDEKIVVVPLAVEDCWLKNIPYSMKEKERGLNVAYWGNFLKQHGVEVALSAAKELSSINDIKFYFYGTRSNKLKSLFEKYKNINFIDFNSNRDELIEFVDEMDISFGHLLPIHDAHLMLPNKALEGMARGKVVMHIDSPSLYDCYGKPNTKERAVVFFNNEERGLSDAILDLYNQREKMEKIGSNACKNISRNNSVCAVSESLTHMFEAELSRK